MELSNITVYTSLNNDKDTPVEGVLNICTYDKFTDPRRNSRASKILAHTYINSEFSIYIDGNITLNVSPETIIDKYLKDYDIAVFRHPVRDCIFDEAMTCAKLKLDDPEIIIEQAKAYEDLGFAKHKGLAECGIIIRRHTPEIENFNNTWWAEYSRYSRRDQISFMFAADRVGLRVNIIDDYFISTSPTTAIKQSGDFSIKTHNHTR